jgi:hypothetical protein
LRKRLDAAGAHATIRVVRGVGYRLEIEKVRIPDADETEHDRIA